MTYTDKRTCTGAAPIAYECGILPCISTRLLILTVHYLTSQISVEITCQKNEISYLTIENAKMMHDFFDGRIMSYRGSLFVPCVCRFVIVLGLCQSDHAYNSFNP